MADTKSTTVEPSKESTIPRLAYSPHEAALALGVCDETVYRLLKRGLLKSSSKLRHKLIPVSELERFLRETSTGGAR
jgi:excisionase family DNA binding protein